MGISPAFRTGVRPKQSKLSWDRYANACDDLHRRSAAAQLEELELLANSSLPVISMSFEACDDILRSGKYHNYQERMAAGIRVPATPSDHANRQMVGEKLYPSFSQHIHYAVLSPDGHGLPTYGSVSLRWQVVDSYLLARSSLLEDNSFTFFEKHNLGRLHSLVPVGYQAVWEERAKLVVAKLAGSVSSATAMAQLPDLLLQRGESRPNDEFVEIAIFAKDGFDTKDVDMITIETRPTTSDEMHRWEIIKSSAGARSPPIDVT